MAAPRRREQRRAHLDAPVVPVERALLDRAETLDGLPPGDQPPIPMTVQDVRVIIAHELRSLAETLHWW